MSPSQRSRANLRPGAGGPRPGHAPTNRIPQELVPLILELYPKHGSEHVARVVGVDACTVTRYARLAGLPVRRRGGRRVA